MTDFAAAKRSIANRNHRTPVVKSIRPLVPADMDELRKPTAISVVKTLRDSHHMVARYLALGKSVTETAEVTGYSPVRISILKADPSFIELITRYRAEVHEIWREHADALTGLATTNMVRAERQIADALDKADEEGSAPIPLRDLSRITADRMDRFGYGKHSTSTNINVGFAARLEACISRSRRVEDQSE
jgi:hypothetical protein